MKQSLIKLALKGMDINTLINNLVAMNPDYYLIERLIDGVELPTVEQFIAKKSKPVRNITIRHLSDFDERNIEVKYEYADTAYSNTPVEGILEKEEFEKLNTNWSKSEAYPYMIQYWCKSTDKYCSEDFLL